MLISTQIHLRFDIFRLLGLKPQTPGLESGSETHS